MKVKECNDTLDMILEIEGGHQGLIAEDFEDLNKIKSLCVEFMYSQGFYGRLYRDIEELEERIENGKLDFPLIF